MCVYLILTNTAMLLFYRFIYVIETLAIPFLLPSIAAAKGIERGVGFSLFSIALMLINILFMLITFILFYSSEKRRGNSEEDIFLISFMSMMLCDYLLFSLFTL